MRPLRAAGLTHALPRQVIGTGVSCASAMGANTAAQSGMSRRKFMMIWTAAAAGGSGLSAEDRLASIEPAGEPAEQCREREARRGRERYPGRRQRLAAHQA